MSTPRYLLRSSAWLAAALSLSLLGCLEPSSPDEPVDPPAPGAPPEIEQTLDPGDLEQVPDGTHGWARLQLPHGIELLPYVAYKGHAIHEGDIDLGPIERVDARLRGGALTSAGDRWSNNYVEFAFHSNMDSAARTTIREAMAELEAVTPVDFKEVAYGKHTGPWVEFKYSSDPKAAAGSSSAIGMMGCGEIHCSTEGDCRTDCGQWLYFNKSKGEPTKSTTKHEVLHALGMWHEQARNDRDDYIDYAPWCVASSSSQFSIQSSSLDLGLYDYSSIMHYSSFANCKTVVGQDDPYLGACMCLPMTKKDIDDNNDGKPDRIWPSSDLTGEDVNTMWRAYSEPVGVNGNGDGFGKALAVGDFDGDGYDDVAVGAPGNPTSGVAGSGAVFLYKGSSVGMLPWRTLSQAGIGSEDVGAGDNFGAALVAADLNGDKIDELVVGVPGEDLAAVANAGKVHVYKGQRGGPKLWYSLTQEDAAGTSEADDAFGSTLAAGNVAGVGMDLAIGAPTDRVTGAFTNAKSGAVYLFHGSPDDLLQFRATRLAYGFGTAGDRFGAAIAIGKIDEDGNADVAIGAPGANRVMVYAGRTPPEEPGNWTSMALFRQAITGPQANADFGKAVFIGDVYGTFNLGHFGELVIGAPKTASSVGRAYVYRLATPALTGSSSMVLLQELFSNGAQEAGDEFGAAITGYHRVFATQHVDVVIGSPGENDDQGIVTLYRGTWDGLVADANVSQTVSVWDVAEAGDRFGETLAFGAINGIGDTGSTEDFTPGGGIDDLVVAAPGERIGLNPGTGPSAGQVSLLLGTGNLPITGGSSHQETVRAQ